jgi:hypothetical protein
MSDKHLENVAQARREYYDAQRRLRESRRRLRQSVIDARKKKHSLRRIAEMAGVSNVTILNWSRDEDSG